MSKERKTKLQSKLRKLYKTNNDTKNKTYEDYLKCLKGFGSECYKQALRGNLYQKDYEGNYRKLEV